MISFRNAAAATGVAVATIAALPANAQTTLTMSSWVSPAHHLTSVVLQGYADEVEKASGGRIRFQMLPKHPSAAPGTFDAVRDGLVDVSYVTASYTPARHVLPLVAELPGAVAGALGASEFVQRAPESYELLSSGIADGVFFPQESIVSFKLDQLVKSATLFPGGFYSSSFGFFINEDKWSKFSKEDQALLARFGGEHLAP